LEAAIAAFDCRVVFNNRIAGHEVLYGVVTAVHLRDAGSPLLHSRRVYRRLGPDLR
jgi:flavin reductase (DIM6/NTAB) family NADH-FMN oxidoreductase RutF